MWGNQNMDVTAILFFRMFYKRHVFTGVNIYHVQLGEHIFKIQGDRWLLVKLDKWMHGWTGQGHFIISGLGPVSTLLSPQTKQTWRFGPNECLGSEM